jgi:hypothetical protein
VKNTFTLAFVAEAINETDFCNMVKQIRNKEQLGKRKA